MSQLRSQRRGLVLAQLKHEIGRKPIDIRLDLLDQRRLRSQFALATGAPSLYDGPTLARVGLKKGSVRKALSGLRGRGGGLAHASYTTSVYLVYAQGAHEH